uniref:Transmembrane protein 65 n=2 Tax=Parascaris univalens TaxID=6257 RepID=A0A915C1W9_PARUN
MKVQVMMMTGSCLLRYNTANFCIVKSLPRISQRNLLMRPLLRRYSTSGVISNVREMRIENDSKARKIAANLRPEERRRLLDALDELSHEKIISNGRITKEQLKQLFIINAVPFIGFGFLDNVIMIVAGEYIDQSLGAWLAISTMAAAALGNLISDLAGMGLAHYVEFLVSKFGLKHPVLTSQQLESSTARSTINLGRAFGLVVGCLVGMFPLLFFDSSK